MRVIQASVHSSGKVRAWLQTEDGERVYATVSDQAMTDGLLGALGEAIEADLRARGIPLGRQAIQGRERAAGGPRTRDRQP